MADSNEQARLTELEDEFEDPAAETEDMETEGNEEWIDEDDEENGDGAGDDDEFVLDEEFLRQIGAIDDDSDEPRGEDGGIGGDNGQGEEAVNERTARQRRQVILLLQNSPLARMFYYERDEGENNDDDDIDDDTVPRYFSRSWAHRRSRRPKPDPNRFPKVPSKKGTALMREGYFGSEEWSLNKDEESNVYKKDLARRIFDRELATDNFARQRLNQSLMTQELIPSTKADMIIHYNAPVYSGQFSDDGNFFFSAIKDFKVRMYDTSNPYKWKYYKTVEYPWGQWTLTDASLSRDNKYLAYTSIRSTVCLAPTDPNDEGDPYILNLADTGGGTEEPVHYSRGSSGSFGIWSVRFSADGRQLVAGTTGGSIVVYDIESRRPLHRIFGHHEDVNAVCFADSSAPHILYSGSDDATIKVWDTRSMNSNGEAGAFVGHTEGITYIDSKDDGRYIVSNGKEQSMKLWDLRMVMSKKDFVKVKSSRRRSHFSHFDYRNGPYDEDDWELHPNDNSVVTFRGHKVLRTLIRCHFSPPNSTNSRYVYSGSADGKVYIWNMDATIAGVVDVFKATENSRPTFQGQNWMRAWDDDASYGWETCVRDASWHPNAPMIVASAWNGYGMSTGTCTVHSWNDGLEDDEGEPKMGQRVNQKLARDPSLYDQREASYL